MTFENISENSVINAVGRLVDPGKKINMPVDYYSLHKAFVDGYVSEKKAKITGEDEYSLFVKKGKPLEEKKDTVDLMAEVIGENKAVAPVKEETPVEKEAVEPKPVAKKPAPLKPKPLPKKEEDKKPAPAKRGRKTADPILEK